MSGGGTHARRGRRGRARGRVCRDRNVDCLLGRSVGSARSLDQQHTALNRKQNDGDGQRRERDVAAEASLANRPRSQGRTRDLRAGWRERRSRPDGSGHGLGHARQATAPGGAPALVAYELAAFMAEAEALHERLVGFVVHLGEQLPAGRVVTGTQAFVVPEGAPDADRECPELPGKAQLPARRRQHEARLATFTRVLDERGGFLGAAHLGASTGIGRCFSDERLDCTMFSEGRLQAVSSQWDSGTPSTAQ